MANDRLRDALMAARVTHEDLAADLGVNTKTVERWITQDRTPYPQFRHRISVLVQKDESWLWPDGYSRKRRSEISRVGDRPRSTPTGPTCPDELWARLFENAIDNIGILVYSGFFLAEQHSRKIELLKKKADDGASIRILLGDPDCPQVALRGRRKTSATRSPRRSATCCSPTTGPSPAIPGINIKLHATTLYNSIYWFDDDMLVNTHAYGVPAHFAPVLHLRHLSSGTAVPDLRPQLRPGMGPDPQDLDRRRRWL